MSTTLLIPLKFIDDNPYQARVDYGNIEELAVAIGNGRLQHPETMGLLQVPQGRLVADDGFSLPYKEALEEFDINSGFIRVQLAFGHRRKRAFDWLSVNRAGYTTAVMPVIIRDFDDEAMIDAVYTENANRKDITSIEEARLLKAKLAMLKDDGKKRSQKDVAQEWGISRPMVANKLRLLKLPEGIQQANEKGELSERQCLALLSVVALKEKLKAAKSKVKWSKHNYMWTPSSPDNYIDTVLAKNTPSSDIQEYVKRAAAFAGEELHGVIPTHKCGIGVVQPQCKGCKFRYESYCLKTSCMRVKMEQIGKDTLEKFSRENGIEIGDIPKKAAYNYEEKQFVKKLFSDGDTDNLVAAWNVESSSIPRPFDDGYGLGTGWWSQPEKGIVIHHMGALPQEEYEQHLEKKAAELNPGFVADIPTSSRQQEWIDAAEKVKYRVHNDLFSQIRESLAASNFDENLIGLLLNNKNGKNAIDSLVTTLTDGCRSIFLGHSRPLASVAASCEFAERVGYNVYVPPIEMALMHLAQHYKGRQFFFDYGNRNEDDIADRKENLNAGLEICNTHQVTHFITEFNRALEDVDAIVSYKEATREGQN